VLDRRALPQQDVAAVETLEKFLAPNAMKVMNHGMVPKFRHLFVVFTPTIVDAVS